MNYTIIRDEKLFREFIDWLPDIEEGERYYVCLFARTKYCKDIVHVKSDKQQLKRFLTKKKDMFEKVWQLEVPFGAYTQKGVAMPQVALALYVTPNPRDMWKATHNGLVKMATCIRDNNVLTNPVQEMMSEVHKARSGTHWIDFDIDETEPMMLEITINKIRQLVNDSAIMWLKSRGGMHCMVNPNKVEEQYKRTFWKAIASLPNMDQTGDNMIPVVGCTQGDFTPHFVKPDENGKIGLESVQPEVRGVE